MRPMFLMYLQMALGLTRNIVFQLAQSLSLCPLHLNLLPELSYTWYRIIIAYNFQCPAFVPRPSLSSKETV